MIKIHENVACCARAAGCCIAISVMLAGCSRPTYWVRLRELTSSCDGDVNLRILHDHDPDVENVTIAPESLGNPSANKIAYLKSEGHRLRVGFTSGVVCSFAMDEPEGDCRESLTSDRTAACSAHMEVVKLLPPSNKEGFDDASPTPKVGEQ